MIPDGPGLHSGPMAVFSASTKRSSTNSKMFNQTDQIRAVDFWRHLADQLRPRLPKLATLMDESEADVLACMAFPSSAPDQAAQHVPTGTHQQRGKTACRRGRNIPE